MARKFLMTAFCQDRPGVVADVSQVIYENGCNLEDSAMTSLADQFAMIFLISELSGKGEGDLAEKMARECRRLEMERGISVFIRRVSADAELPKSGGVKKTFHVEGLDQAGIVYKVSRYLADNDVNIVRLKSRIKYSPESGAAIYTMEIQAEIPRGLSMDSFEQGLNNIGDELHIDIAMT